MVKEVGLQSLRIIQQRRPRLQERGDRLVSRNATLAELKTAIDRKPQHGGEKGSISFGAEGVQW